MKVFATICLLLLPVAAIAQPPQGMGDIDIQKMMLQAQEIQACIEKVDQDALQKFQQQAMEVNEEIKSLCAAGKRDEAQKLAIDFGKETEKNKAILEMKKCGELAKGMMPEQIPESIPEIDYSKQHVCDYLEE